MIRRAGGAAIRIGALYGLDGGTHGAFVNEAHGTWRPIGWTLAVRTAPPRSPPWRLCERTHVPLSTRRSVGNQRVGGRGHGRAMASRTRTPDRRWGCGCRSCLVVDRSGAAVPVIEAHEGRSIGALHRTGEAEGLQATGGARHAGCATRAGQPRHEIHRRCTPQHGACQVSRRRWCRPRWPTCQRRHHGHSYRFSVASRSPASSSRARCVCAAAFVAYPRFAHGCVSAPGARRIW